MRVALFVDDGRAETAGSLKAIFDDRSPRAVQSKLRVWNGHDGQRMSGQSSYGIFRGRGCSRQKGLPTAGVVPDPAFHLLISRSHQHQLRRFGDEQGPQSHGDHVWAGEQHILCCVHRRGNPEQYDDAEVRCPDMDTPDHDHLGSCIRGDDVCDRSLQPLCLARADRSGRGRVHAGHSALPDILVSLFLPCACHGVFYHGAADYHHVRLVLVGMDSRHARLSRTGRVEMAVPAGGITGSHSWNSRLFLSGRPA